MHYRPGIEIVPGYRLQKMLGRGGFGEVWQAEGPGRVSAAVKIIDKVEEKAGRKEFRALKLIKDLRHPNLVSITGFWLKDADGRLLDSDAYIDEAATSSEIRPSELVVAMDLCEKSLLDRLAECRKGLSEDMPGGIPLDELLEYMEAAAKAIDYLNAKHQIQHRDIKPHNIMIVGGSAQVCDFGLASAISTARTSMGGAGSLAYMAPEVYSTKLPSGATDQYSLAITYCELRTGRLPLSDVESFAVLDDAKRKGMLDLSLLDERERGPILRAAALDPAARFPTCYDMVQDLRRAMSAGFSVSAPARAEPIAGYQLERSLRDRDGEQIWDAVDPDGLHVSLVVRTFAEAPGTADWATLSAVRDVSRGNPRLAEIYEFAFLSATDKVLPARLFKLPNPPAPAKVIIAGRKLPNNMSERLSLGGMPIKRLLLLLGDLAEGLDFFNATQHGVDGKMFGFQHTNVRPVNFLLDGDRAVLSNFAAAQMLAGDVADFPAGKQLPESPFLPPEFAAGKITRWSDQYMLAVSYLQLRTGKPSASLSSSTGSGKRPDARSRLDTSELKPREREILAQATDADPKKRYPTCREFAAALGRAWDEIIAAEVPRAEPESPKRKSTHDPAAATLDAAAVESVSLSSVRDSAPTALEPAPKVAPKHGATLVPSAIETRPPRDTNPDEDAPPQRIADKPQRGPRPPKQKTKQSAKQQTKPQPAAVAQSPAKPWWQSRGAILAGIAIAALAVAIPIALSGGGGTIEQEPKPNVDPAIAALENEIKRLIADHKFADAFDKLQANRAKLGATGDTLADQVSGDWGNHVEIQVAAAVQATDQRQLQIVAADAGLLLARIPESIKGRAGLAASAQALVGLYKQDLARRQLPKPECERIAAGAEVLSITLSAVSAPDPAAIAAAKLVQARAAWRAEGSLKAQEPLAQIDPQQFADSRDKATCDTLKTLADVTLSQDLTKLTSLKAMYLKRLDPWDLDALQKQIDYLQGDERAKLMARWSQLAAELGPKVLENGPALAETRQRLVDLPTADVKLWTYLTNPTNADAHRRYRGLLMLATLRLDGLPEAEYARQIEDLSERINVERVGDDAAVLCAAALDRALALESTLSYNDAAKSSEAQRLIGLARSTAESAATNFKTHAGSITESLANTDRRRVELAEKQLRTLRDSANFPALKLYAEGVASSLRNVPAAEALRSACIVECNLQEKKPPTASARDALRSSVAVADALDKEYIAFVAAIAREETLSSRLADAADAIQAAYTASGAHVKWREHGSRKTPALDRLEAAAKVQAQGDLAKLAPAYYSPQSDAARKSAAWLATAVSFFPTERSPASETVFRRLRQLQSLATYYARPSDSAAVKQVAAWTDELLAGNNAGNNAGGAPLHVVLVNARSHATSGDEARAAMVYRRLFDACRTAIAKDVKTGPTPKEIDEHVLAPAVVAIGNAVDAAKLQGESRQAAARLFAASGRYAHLYPVVQARVRKQLDAEGKKDDTVAKVAFDWLDAAVKLDPKQAEYLYGRGYSCDFRLEMPYADRADQMEKDATAALAAAGKSKPFPGAHALRGLGLYYRSLTYADFAKKVESLQAANEAYKKAIAMHLALIKTPAAAGDFSQTQEDYPAFLVGRGFVLLLMANYESDPAKAETLLAESLQLGLDVTKDTTESEAPKHFYGIHPESAYHLVGNALEDYGWLLKRPEYYQLALVQFSKAEGAATRFDNPAGANLSVFYRGRCRYKLAVDGYLATADTLAAFPPAEAQKKSRDALIADLREKASVTIKDASTEISQYIASAGNNEADLNEAHAFLASIQQMNSASESYDKCMASFSSAVIAAEQNAHSPTNRQELLLQQAGAAVDYAIRAMAAKDNSAVNARCEKAVAIAETLTKDANIAAVTRAKANLIIAEAKLVNGPEYREKMEEALAEAIKLAKPTGDDVYGTALWQRGELTVKAAARVNPPGTAECDLLVGAAADYFAAIEKQAPLSAERLKYATSLAHVLSKLLQSPVEYSKKAAFTRDKAKYTSKVAEVARQIEEEYASRLDVRMQVVMAAVSNSLVDHAAGLIADQTIKPKLKEAITTSRDKAILALEKWPTQKPTIELKAD
jgi:serine/threonine protein kinase